MMLFPAVLMNFPNSEVCLIGEWSITQLKIGKARAPVSQAKKKTSIDPDKISEEIFPSL